MIRWMVRAGLICLFAFAVPFRSPAPLVYTPGEGWTYIPVGGEAKWRQTTAKDQLDIAQKAFDKKDYKLALKAARRVVHIWEKSDYVPQAQYLAGRSLEALGRDEQAFKEYEEILSKHPKIANYSEILQRQYDIANKYLDGKWFKLWSVIPFFPSMDKTAAMYEKIVKNGPYSTVAPLAQMKIGVAREKQKDYPLAAKAFETAADRYHDRQEIAADATFKEAMAYDKQSQKAEYDQTMAGQAIATFTDFLALYPNDPRSGSAQTNITSLHMEQARGNFQIARFYEKRKKWDGALIYYNEVLVREPNSPFAAEARKRIDALKQKTQRAS
jgi:outer membrane protein assembly factor BamD